jgi:protein-L-isoaspartate(D-aspartate) O-methyltransferase
MQHRKRWAIAVGVAALVALAAACGGDGEDKRTVPLESLLTPVETPAGDDAPTSPPADTFPPTPETLDRQLDDDADMRQRRAHLVSTYVASVVQTGRVLDAMRAVPRHAFVPTRYLDQAYNDHPLPIGYGQTISQPSLVAMMTDLLALEEGDRVLEIGTGSGYQAAILRELTPEVYTIEIIPELAGTARRIFDELGYADIRTLRADGYYGWEAFAPFDAIIVTAAPDHLPSPLVAQLKDEGGRMVIPIGPPGGYQSLWFVQRHGDDIDMNRLLDVMFVPFTREADE